MEKKTKKNESCCSCNADFKNEMNELVDNVEGYTKEEKKKKQEEVKAAFSEKDKK